MAKKLLMIMLAMAIALAQAAPQGDGQHPGQQPGQTPDDEDDHDGSGKHKYALTNDGKCPEFKTMESMDSTKMNGQWTPQYVVESGIQRDASAQATGQGQGQGQEQGQGQGQNDKHSSKRCFRKNLTAKPDGSFDATITYKNENNEEMTKKTTSTLVNGKNTQQTIRPQNDDDKDKDNDSDRTKTVSFLDSDNGASYMVTVACVTDGSKHGYKAYVYSRQNTPMTKEAEDKAKAALKANNMSENWEAVNQNC